MQTTALTVFGSNGGENGEIATRESVRTNGMRSITFVTKKDYGIMHKLKGQELRRAHDKYRAELGVAGNAGLTGMIAAGQVLVQKVSETKNGFNATFIRASVLDLEKDPAIVKKEVLDGLTDEELLALMEARKAQSN